MAALLLLNGPNLNLLGTREPEVYGSTTLAEIEAALTECAERAGHRLHCFQANGEGELVDRVQQAKAEDVAWIVVNPGAYAHTSIALRDAFEAVRIPFVEIHISNVHAREPFRHHSHLSAIARGVVCGLGVRGYDAALDHAVAELAKAGA